MKLYKITATDPDEGVMLTWAGTQADAKRIRKEQGGVSIDEVDVPTDKPGLLAWLNAHFDRDNG
jgi:hypothetical protein